MSAATPSENTSPISAQIISLSEMHPPSNTHAVRRAAPAPREAGFNPLHDIKATLTVCVGTVVMTVGDLLKAKADEVLRLDSAIDEPVQILLEGKVVACGQLVAVDDHFGVRITQVHQSLKA